MSKEKKNTPKKEKDKETKKEEDQMDKELEQTFPASDPPSHSSPGSDRDEGDKS